MGYYINTKRDGTPLAPRDKADSLIADGATEISEPTKWQPNLVCVVQNGVFDAAAYAFSENEMRAFLPSFDDSRPRRWLIVPDAAQRSGFTR